MNKRVKYFESDSVLEEFYQALADKNEKKLRRVHIPRSDVFYIRRAYYESTGHWVSLDRMESHHASCRLLFLVIVVAIIKF